MLENMKKVPGIKNNTLTKELIPHLISIPYFSRLHSFFLSFLIFCFLLEGSKVNGNLPAEFQLMRKLKAYDTIQEHNQ